MTMDEREEDEQDAESRYKSYRIVVGEYAARPIEELKAAGMWPDTSKLIASPRPGKYASSIDPVIDFLFPKEG